MRESYPLVWLEGWPRTPLKDREQKKQWKKTEPLAIADLELELKRFGVVAPVLTRKDPHDSKGAADPSVAVYFSRSREEDYSWQAALGIENPAPTLDEIKAAFLKLALRYHPDNQQTGDLETYQALDAHRKNAVAYVNRMIGSTHELGICCDRYSEARWNIFAISNTVYSLRQMERDGASSLLERALKGFAAALPEKAVTHVTSSN